MRIKILNVNTEKINSVNKQLNCQFLTQLFLVLFTIFITILELIISKRVIYNLASAIVFTLSYLLVIKILKIRIKNLVYPLISILIAYLLLKIIFNTIPLLILFPFIILIISEMFVNIAPNLLKKRNQGNKILFNSTIFGITTFIMLCIFSYFQTSEAWLYNIFNLILFSAAGIAIILSATYYLSQNFIKFFSIPVLLALLVYFLIFEGDAKTIHFFTISISLATIIAFLSYEFRFLTFDGVIAQFILASLIFNFGGMKWTLPVITFFLLSSLLSKLNHTTNAQLFYEKPGIRDSSQVLANGGFGGILILIYQFAPSELLYWFYVSFFSVVSADTWATEIGTLRKAKTISLLTFKKVEQGISGGVSLPGTVGAVLGAFIIALSSLIWIRSNEINFIFLITFTGFFGSFIDSVMGATVQAQYKCNICDKITERKYHCNNKTMFAKGFYWLNNNMVNFFSALCGGLIIIFIKEILKV